MRKLKTIEELVELLGVPLWQARGLAVWMKWATGKQLSEVEFRAALAQWLASPIAGR